MPRKEPMDRLRKKPVTQKVGILADEVPQPDLIEPIKPSRDAFPEARDFLEAEAKYNAELKVYRDAKEAYEKALADATITFTFKSIGRKRYEDLVLKHPATEDQVKKVKAEQGEDTAVPWNADTFIPALLHLCCTDPPPYSEMTSKEWQDLCAGDTDEAWNQGEIGQLFTAALVVNTVQRVASMGKGFGTILG